MKLFYTHEKLVNGKSQELEIVSKQVYSLDDVEDLGYDDFKCYLKIDGMVVAEISDLLAKTGVWVAMIDDVDWYEEYRQIKLAYNEKN